MSTFLLEIGTEEIPHWMIPGALAQLAKLDLQGAVPKVDATPRRLVIRAEGLPTSTPDSTTTITGPGGSAGELAKTSFAKKHQANPDDLTFVGGKWAVQKTIKGRQVRDILAEYLPTAILGIQWPKTMYWGAKGGPRFIRPIRWIVALLDDQVIDFEIAGVKSGNLSRGHRVLANKEIKVDYASIEATLRANHVILSASERRTKIENEAKQLGATVDPELLETLTYITESPAAIKGDFDLAYLELPAEVLTMVMRHHQKYFAVKTNPNQLAPHFVAVMNVPADPDGLVKQGNERVLKARFNDARFFWEVDQKKKLADRVEDLSHVTFQAKLGSYLEKTNRVVALVKELGGDEHAQRAAWLAKADLTTEMVKEFTDLQGIVGGLYAKHQGEPEEVSRAISEHYKPLSMEDAVPSTWAGKIVALADKLDSLRSFFEIDLIPSGSKDPFALRRAAQGVVKILAEFNYEFVLQDVVRAAFSVRLNLKSTEATYGSLEVRRPDGRLKEEIALEAFLLERVQYYFREHRGFKYDEVNAVLAAGISTLMDVNDRLIALAKVRPTSNFEPIAAGLKRIRKIIPEGFVPERSVNRDLLESGPERDLYEAFQGKPGVGGVLALVSLRRSERKYLEAFENIASLRPQIDAFFDKVMVNAPDEKVRANRLTLLYQLLTEFSTIADFSEIVPAPAASIGFTFGLPQ